MEERAPESGPSRVPGDAVSRLMLSPLCSVETRSGSQLSVTDPIRRASECTCRCVYVSNIRWALRSLIWAETELEEAWRGARREAVRRSQRDVEAAESVGAFRGKARAGKDDSGRSMEE